MHLTTYIGADLNVYTCCNNAYSTRGLVGNVGAGTVSGFTRLWNSSHKQAFFDLFDARDCARCQFNAKNRSIARLVGPPAGHDNFV